MTLPTINPLNKKEALGILLQAFRRNPNITWMARKATRKYIKSICTHCLDLASSRGGAYLSRDRKGVVLVYERGGALDLRQKVYESLLKLRLFFTAIRWFGLGNILAQQREVAQHSPKERHLYCLILAVNKKEHSMNTVVELKDFLFHLSKERGLPIYAQTSLERNQRLFERYGFKTYHTIENKSGKYQLHLLKKTH